MVSSYLRDFVKSRESKFYHFTFLSSLHCGKRGKKPVLIVEGLKEKKEVLAGLQRKLQEVQERGVVLDHSNVEGKLPKTKQISEENTRVEALEKDLTVSRQRYECSLFQTD